MPTTTKTDPLAERERLLDVLARIEERDDAVNARRAKAEADLNAAHAELAQLHIAEVRGDATPAAVEKARSEVKRLDAEVEAAATDAHPIAAARRKTEREMLALHKAHRDAFEAEAEDASAAAAAALAELVEPLKAAAQAWFNAQSAWGVLERRLGFPEDTTPVPPFPLPVVIDRVQPRPYERRLDTDQVAPGEMPVGTVAVFRNVNGEEEVVGVGSGLYDAFIGPDSTRRLVHYVTPAGKDD
jgi:hypothetical protein